MLILHPGDAVPAGTRFVAAIGNFDGVHAGHRYLLGEVVAAARQRGCSSLVITFWPHPRAVLQPERWPGDLTTLEERSALFAALGLDAMLVFPFTPELSRRTPAAFVDLLLATVPLVELWVGADFRFGYQRSGEVATLRGLAAERGLSVQAIARQRQGGEDIGSGAIRQLVRDGQVTAAAALLGRPYRLGGIVVEGDRRGRQLGYPTANLAPDAGKLVPGRGIYAARAYLTPQDLTPPTPLPLTGKGGVVAGFKPAPTRDDSALQAPSPGLSPMRGGEVWERGPAPVPYVFGPQSSHSGSPPRTGARRRSQSGGLPGGEVLPAAVSIGVRPQFDGDRELVEAYLLDFSGDLYGRRLELDFLARLRDEERFESVEALLDQMARDVAQARSIAAQAPPNR